MKYIHAKVLAGARKEGLKEKDSEHFLISVKEKAENNMANTRVLEVLAEHLKIPKAKIRIVNGHRTPSKLLVLED